MVFESVTFAKCHDIILQHKQTTPTYERDCDMGQLPAQSERYKNQNEFCILVLN